MTLVSAMNTALTGLAAAELQLDVAANNLANSQTTAFKSSRALFAEQIVQTGSLGSSPSATNGGTNPRQVGLGTKVAVIQPDFSQGGIATSGSATDVAIQGDGFFIVENAGGETLYTRNGEFSVNAIGELVTAGGGRVLGHAADDDFVVQPVLSSLTIPFGRQIAVATSNVTLSGVLRPDGDIADTATILASGELGDESLATTPPVGNAPVSVVGPSLAAAATVATGAGSLDAGEYRYRAVFIDGQGNESAPSDSTLPITASAGDAVDLANLPVAPAGPPGDWTARRIYRSLDSGSYFRLLDIPDLTSTTVTDSTPQASVSGNPTLVDTAPGNGNFQYRIAFSSSTGVLAPSRPSAVSGSILLTANGARMRLTGLPVQSDLPAGYDSISIYRTLASDPSTFYRVAEISPATGPETTFIDATTDSVLSQQPQMDTLGPRISLSTLLTDVVKVGDTGNIEHVIPSAGTIRFSGRKNGITTDAQELTVGATTTIGEMLDFMSATLGTQTNSDPLNPIPPSASATGLASPGGRVIDGTLQLVGNNGIPIDVSSFSFVDAAGVAAPIDVQFGELQAAVGETVSSTFLAFDSLGVPINMRLHMALEARDGNTVTYRWFADTPDNQAGGTAVDVSVGTGLVSFDGNGVLLSTSNTTVSVDRATLPSVSPLTFDLDFSEVGSLANDTSVINVSQQDGAPSGTLTSFNIGEDGRLTGSFSSGLQRTIGQLRMVRFPNNTGLDRVGDGMFRTGPNSGLPLEDNPNVRGIGTLVVGARELSNANVGESLVDLITATTLYRGTTRVISTTQQMLEEILNLRR